MWGRPRLVTADRDLVNERGASSRRIAALQLLRLLLWSECVTLCRLLITVEPLNVDKNERVEITLTIWKVDRQ